MNTPICDFVKSYTDKNKIRLHMPGHKGKSFLGYEAFDITEISGADSLYEADGIIRESEKNASVLFGCETFYSTEGSSLAIRAMLYLVCLYALEKGEKPLILAARNSHKVFLNSAAVLDFDVEWLYSDCDSSYLSCEINAESLDIKLHNMSVKPIAVYITSPDYLGNESDIRSIADVCHKHGVLLLVDNAHGAYLKFLPVSRHPIDLGADICCDSAHKTLPVLTGGAYLHISDYAPQVFRERTKEALALFGSTSPSYLILQSLDFANKYIDGCYKEKLQHLVEWLSLLKQELITSGFEITGSEELKLTINTKSYGYEGCDFASVLSEKGIECEYSDPDFVVMMFTVDLLDSLVEIRKIIFSIPRKDSLISDIPKLTKPSIAMSIKDACLKKSEVIYSENSKGRILASASVSCPPAVPVVVSGEVVSDEAVKCFKYYGIKKCRVIID